MEIAGLGREIIHLGNDVTTATDFFENSFPALDQPVERLGVVLGVINNDPLVAFNAYLVFRVRQILRRQPPINRVLRDLLDRERRVFVFVTAEAFDNRLAHQLNVAHRKFVARFTPIKVVDRHCLLELRRIGLECRNPDERTEDVLHQVATDEAGRIVCQSARMLVIRRAQQQRRRVHRAAGNHDRVAREDGLLAFHFGHDAGDFATRRARVEAQHLCFGDDRDVGLLHHRPDGDDVGIRLRADQTGIAVAGVATDARAEVHHCFVDAHAHRRGIRLHAPRFQDLKNLFDARLVAYRRMWIFL